MQEFLLNNTVNCNLMSLTGYRTLVLLSILMESPKSTDEINEYFLNNQYIGEKFSIDTLRIYLNSLRAIGCNITRANKLNEGKYELISHPFNFDIRKSQLKAISKLYKTICDKIDIKDLLAIEDLFDKIASKIKNDKDKISLKNISVLKNIDRKILNELIINCKNKNQITFLYNSPKSQEKVIEIISDKITFKSGQLYLCGQSITHGEHSYFRLDRILKLLTIKIKKDETELPKIKLVYELYNNIDYIPEENEKIIEKMNEKIVIEALSENKFSIIQKILSNSQNCKVVSPHFIRKEITDILQEMKECYR